MRIIGPGSHSMVGSRAIQLGSRRNIQVSGPGVSPCAWYQARSGAGSMSTEAVAERWRADEPFGSWEGNTCSSARTIPSASSCQAPGIGVD